MAKKLRLGSKELREISDTDLLCVHNDLISYDEWMNEGPTEEKIANCKRRLFAEWYPKLADAGIPIPVNEEDRINLIVSQPTYKNRKQREEVVNDVVSICKDSGKLSKVSCPFHRTRSMIFKKGTAPAIECDVH